MELVTQDTRDVAPGGLNQDFSVLAEDQVLKTLQVFIAHSRSVSLGCAELTTVLYQQKQLPCPKRSLSSGRQNLFCWCVCSSTLRCVSF